MLASQSKRDTSSSKQLYLVLLFVLWYGFNAAYNVYNAFVKDDIEFPIFVALLQLVIGLLYALPLWILGLREVPQIRFEDVITLLPISFLNALGHYGAVAAMFQKGGGSFTHVIKASEPVASVILGLVVNGTIPKLFTALSLIPITYGVAYASTLGNLSIASMQREFTTKAARLAMTSNVSFALRSIIRKNLKPEFKERTKLTAANDHAVITILSALILVPFAFIYEDPIAIVSNIQSFPEQKFRSFTFNLAMSGFSFYLYNEFQNMVLGSLGAVPTAVGNTFKRVVIFVALYFCIVGETFPFPKILGSAIAIVGCLAFAVFDSKKI